ncbi:MAG: hypothetical protein HY889_10130 [Deltaproteobacteria bacterium]|nr:hypothetical protein [Deltaproteobacteria bacterium]
MVFKNNRFYCEECLLYCFYRTSGALRSEHKGERASKLDSERSNRPEARGSAQKEPFALRSTSYGVFTLKREYITIFAGGFFIAKEN